MKSRIELTPMCREEEHGRHKDGLDVHKFNWMNSCHWEGSRLFVRVVKLMEVFVQERDMVPPMMPVGQIILRFR